MYEIPTTIEVGGKTYHIRNKGDFRVILDCFRALDDPELENVERLMASLIIFYEELDGIDNLYEIENINDLVTAMYNFFNCNTPDGVGANKHRKLVDWQTDEQLICSAVNKVANMEIRLAPYIHWWTFIGYYTSVGESSLSTVISIRDKIVRGKKLEKHEREFRLNNPQYFVWNARTTEESEADKLVRNLWGSEG